MLRYAADSGATPPPPSHTPLPREGCKLVNVGLHGGEVGWRGDANRDILRQVLLGELLLLLRELFLLLGVGAKRKVLLREG